MKYQQSMENLKNEVFHKHCEEVSKKDLSRDLGISDSTVERYFKQNYIRKNKELCNKCPLVLGMDEHYFSKKRRYATTFVNLSKHKVFDVALGRSEQELLPYLSQLRGKDKVRVIVMDLSSNYRSVAKKYFPNALIVSDRFYVAKLVLDSFIKTAYGIDKNLKKHCKFKDCKKRLISKLLKFIELLKECGFEMFKKLGKTIEKWSEEIARMLRFTKSNGITEGWRQK